MTKKERVWRVLCEFGIPVPIHSVARQMGDSHSATWHSLQLLRRRGSAQLVDGMWIGLPQQLPVDMRGKCGASINKHWPLGNRPWNKDGVIPSRKSPTRPEPETVSLWQVWRPCASPPVANEIAIRDNSPREDAPEETVEAA